MHKCARCGRAASSLEEIEKGCPCGSKIFVFDKDAVESAKNAEWKEVSPPWAQLSPPIGKQEGQEQGGNGKEGQENNAIPPLPPHTPSYSARATFTSEDIENIKVMGQGVFILNLKAISGDPLVIKDEEGIYYIRLPIENGYGAKLLKKE